MGTPGTVALEVGKIYRNGRGDYFGPMVNPAFDLWLDQYDTGYKANGRIHNHAHDSAGNLIAEVSVEQVCRAHNDATARLAALEADARRYRWLTDRGVAWQGCFRDHWLEGEWLYTAQGADKVIDEAIAALSQEPAEGG